MPMDWWNTTPSRFDNEAYERRLQELAKERAEEERKLMEEDAIIEETTDPEEKLRLRRDRYDCYEYVTVDDLEKWADTARALSQKGLPKIDDYKVKVVESDTLRRFPVQESVNEKVYLHQGDITELEVDAIVNAANGSLLGGGGIDGAIHNAAGPLLVKECRKLNGCETGQTKITKGFSLPAKFVLHTVGPFGKGDYKLQSCYRSCLELAKERGLRSVAFCCVGTGIYSFPLVRAAHIALCCVREWMEANPDALDAVVFCVFQRIELEVYQSLMPSYFPVAGFPAREVAPDVQDAVPINDASISAEMEAEQRDDYRHSAYYSKWLDSSPADEDEQLKADSVPRVESNASMYE